MRGRSDEKEKQSIEEKLKYLWRQLWPDNYPYKVTFTYGEKPLNKYVEILAKDKPEKTALIYYGRKFSYKELDDLAGRFANALTNMGYKKGDALGLYVYNGPQTFIATLGAWKIGMYTVTIDPLSKEYELEYRIKDSGVKIILSWDINYPYLNKIKTRVDVNHVIVASYHDYLPSTPSFPIHYSMEKEKETYKDTIDFLDLVKEYKPLSNNADVDVNDYSVMIYTSGTTGLPKGAMHVHHSNLLCAWVHKEILFSYCKTFISGWPTSHVSGQIVHNTVFYGLTTVLLPRWDPKYFGPTLEAIEKYKVDALYLPTPMWGLLIRNREMLNKYDISSLKRCVAVDFALNLAPEMIKAWKKLTGLDLFEFGLGMTETFNYQITGFPEMPFKIFMKGIPLPNVEIRICSMDNPEATLSVGEVGEICVKTPSLFKFYWNKPDETKNAFTKDGWFLTGDVGYISDSGWIYMTGRKKYVLKISGFTVSPEEIEMVGRKNPDIIDIGVIGIPHPHKGQVAKAYIVLNPSSKKTPEEIKEWFKEHIASIKVPEIKIVESIPRTLKGATDYKKLYEIEKM